MQKVKSFVKQRRVLTLSVGLVVVALIGAGGYFFYQQQQIPKTPDEIAQKEFEEVTKKREDLIKTVNDQTDLPTNEEPLLATVSDKEKLLEQNPEFFKLSENGDRLLLYPKNKKIYLYRPDEKKVIATSPLKYQDKPEVAATSSAQSSESAGLLTPQ